MKHTAMKATAKLSEKIVTKQIIDFMRAHRWRAIRLQSGLFSRPLSQSRVRIGESGMPDWLFLRNFSVPGVFKYEVLFVEVKASGRNATPNQLQWAKQALADGFDTMTTSSVDDFIAGYRSRYAS